MLHQTENIKSARLFLNDDKDIESMFNYCKEKIAIKVGSSLENSFLEKLQLLGVTPESKIRIALLGIRKYDEEHEVKYVVNVQLTEFEKCQFVFKLTKVDQFGIFCYSFSFNDFKEHTILSNIKNQQSGEVANGNLFRYFPSYETFIHFVRTFAKEINFPCINLEISGSSRLCRDSENPQPCGDLKTNPNSNETVNLKTEGDEILPINEKYLDRVSLTDLKNYITRKDSVNFKDAEAEFLHNKKKQISDFLNCYGIDKGFYTANDKWITVFKHMKKKQIVCDFSLNLVDGFTIKFFTKVGIFPSGDMDYEIEIDPFGKNTDKSTGSPYECDEKRGYFRAGGFVVDMKYFPKNWNIEKVKKFIQGLLEVIYDGSFEVYGENFHTFDFGRFDLF